MAEGLTFITTTKASRTLGVSEQSVRTWCRLGLLPATRPAGTRNWLIVEKDFLSWLESGAGQRVTAFLDPDHRSTAAEDELLEDANEALARQRSSSAHGRRERPATGKVAKPSA